MSVLRVSDNGLSLPFRLEDLTRYHGPGSPAGVALALKVVERAFRLVGRGGVLERREITVATPFPGPVRGTRSSW